MAEQSAALIRTVRVIDRFTDTTGMWLAWLNLPLVAAVSYEVIAASNGEPSATNGIRFTASTSPVTLALGSAYDWTIGVVIPADGYRR